MPSLRPVRLRLSDPELLADLRQHFSRSGFAVGEESGALIVAPADTPSAKQGQAEIEVHLRVWKTMNPDVEVTVEAE